MFVKELRETQMLDSVFIGLLLEITGTTKNKVSPLSETWRCPWEQAAGIRLAGKNQEYRQEEGTPTMLTDAPKDKLI